MELSGIGPSPSLKVRPGLRHAVIPLVAMAATWGVGTGKTPVRAELLLLAATAAAGLVGLWLGLKWTEMQSGILRSMLRGMPAMLVVVCVGALIASWLSAGTIEMIIYYGLAAVSPKWFLVTACLAACLVSTMTGTSYGTAGTIGVALMGIAHGLGVSPGAAAGAVVAGSYFGDKISPFSATANLAAAAARVNLYDHIRFTMWTTLPALLAGLAVYGVLALQLPSAPFGANAEVESLRISLAAHFRFHPLLLLPPAITLFLAWRRQPVIPGLLLSSAVAVLLAVVFQKDSLAAAMDSLIAGYAPSTGSASLDKLLTQGGFLAMMPPTLIALLAFAFGGLMQIAGLLEPLLAVLSRMTASVGGLIAAAVTACLLVSVVTGSSFLSILIPSELLLPAFYRLNLSGKNLSRTVDDAGTVVVPLIPWSIAGAFMSRTLGVPVVQYAPWAVFCYAGFLFALLYGVTGFAIAPRLCEDETVSGEGS